MIAPDQAGGSLAAAFFDEPGLLAVRFAGAPSVPPLDRYAFSRRPDVAAPANAGWILAIVGVGIAASLVGVAVVTSVNSGRPSPVGWDPGVAPSRSLPAVPDAAPAASGGDIAWRSTLPTLADDLAPTRSDLVPWVVRTLLDVPRDMGRSGDATGGWLAPACSAADREAFRRGAGLAALLRDAGCGPEVAVVLDLPGPTSVAAAAGLAPAFDPVFAIDNLPHPAGVVPSARTLAATVYWRPDFAAARAARAGRPADRGPLFVLEGDRLAAYRNEVGRFDNRSVARLPDAAGFRALGVSRVLYVRAERSAIAEADDLNELFVQLAQADLEVRHLALAAIDPAEPPAEAAPAAAPHASLLQRAWFWRNYGWSRPDDQAVVDPDDEAALYRAARRPTLFSAGAPPVLDGGQREHAAIIAGLVAPPPAPPPPSSSSSSYPYRPSSTTYRPSSYPSSSSSGWYSSSSSSSSSSGGSWSRSSSGSHSS